MRSLQGGEQGVHVLAERYGFDYLAPPLVHTHLMSLSVEQSEGVGASSLHKTIPRTLCPPCSLSPDKPPVSFDYPSIVSASRCTSMLTVAQSRS